MAITISWQLPMVVLIRMNIDGLHWYHNIANSAGRSEERCKQEQQRADWSAPPASLIFNYTVFTIITITITTGSYLALVDL